MTESTTFSETFTVTADNPLLHGHVVHGRNLLPGVGYVDLVLQVLARHGHSVQDVELRNLTILAPLVVGPAKRALTTVEGHPRPDGGWRVEIRSRRPEDTLDVVHAVATVHRSAPAAFTERLRLPVDGAARLTTLDEIYTWCRQYDLAHSGLMKIGGAVHHRAGDWIAEVELAPEHQGTDPAFLFHPALFEAGLLGGGVAIGMLYGDNDGPGLYLPLMFERFRATGPLGSRCYVRVPADSVRRDEELIRLSVEFYDTTGAKVAEVGQFVAKRVRAAASLDVRGDASTLPEPAPAAPVMAASVGGGLVEVVRGLVAARLEVAADQVDAGLGYYELGLASADLLSLVSALEERLSVELSPTVMFEHRTIAELAAWLESQAPPYVPVTTPTAPVPSDLRPNPVAPAPDAAALPSPSARSDDPHSALRAALTEEVAALLRVPVADLNSDAELAEFGMDVGGLARLADRVNARFGLTVPLAAFREHHTLRALAEHLGEHRTTPGADRQILTAQPHPLLHRTVTGEGDGSGAMDTTAARSDVTVPDEHGRVCVELTGLSTRRLRGSSAVAGRREALPPELTDGYAPAPPTERASAAPAPAKGTTPAAPAPADLTPVFSAADTAVPVLEERAVAHLRRMLAAAIKLGPERLDPDTPLERYGMDSVLAVTMVQPLEDTFGPLSRTLLFEVQTVRGLARHLAADHPQELRTLVGEPPSPAAPATPQAAAGLRAAKAPSPVRHGQDHRSQDIAIIGISGRYPHADDLEEFWSALREGRDCVTEVPADRWDTGGRAQWGAFLDGIDRFDPLHFGISPRQAAAMDPQQRLFLETVWHLLEQGGITQEVVERRYRRRVGVYVGAAYQMYRADTAQDPVLSALTSSASYNLIANRVSHFFGLEGPSLAVDSMCTSSAMAVHLACADLLRGECELAVAGGVNLTVHEDKYVALSEMQLLGTHPGARSFRDGDGYLPAEAVGAVLLKPLDAALRDGDTVLAVIKSTASLHSGRSNGFMTPSHRTQVATMRRALERAGAEPGSIGYVESAANGTTFSDEVELRALREVFADVRDTVHVGTVKSNLGHPEAASGIAQLTKVVLQLRHGRVAPLVDAGTPNPRLDLEGSSLRLADRLTDWAPRGAAPRRALVNSVAAGGSHVSLVVEAPPVTAHAERSAPDSSPQVVLVSARTPERLRVAVCRLHAFLEGDDSASLADIAYTSQLCREHLPERLALVAADREQLGHALEQHLADGTAASAGSATTHRGNADEDTGPLTAVLTGTRGHSFVAGLIEDHGLEQLAELWVRGVRVPWHRLHTGPRRIAALPPTAFEPGSYWLDRAPRLPAVETRPPTPPRGFTAPAVPLTGDAGTRTRVRDRIRHHVAELLGFDADQLNVSTPLTNLGIDSATAMRAQVLVEADFGRVLPVAALLDGSSVMDIVDRILDSPVGAKAGEPLVPGSGTRREGFKPLMVPGADGTVRCPATRDVIRLLRSEQLGTPGVTHNIGSAVQLTIGVGRERLTAVLGNLAARHAALRTAIVADPEHGHQLEVGQSLPGALLRWSPVDEDTDPDQRLRELLEPPFELAVAPLWRFELLEYPSGRQVLLYGAHHAVSDLSSLALVAAEIGAELTGEHLSSAPSLDDIDGLMRAQPARQETDGREASAAQPREWFSGIRRLDLTLAKPRPAARSYRAATELVEVPDGLSERVATEARRLGITPAAFWLGTLTMFLARLRERSRFVLAVPVDTRMHAEALDAVGFFGVPIPFPAEANSGESVVEVLRRTDNRLGVHLEKGISFSDTMSTLVAEGLYRKNAPLVEIYFNYLPPRGLKLPGLEMLPAGTGHSDLDLMISVSPDLGHMRLDYNLDILDSSSCARFGREFLDLIAEVLGQAGTGTVGALPGLHTALTPEPLPERPSRSSAARSVALTATFALGNLSTLLGLALEDTGLTVTEGPYHQVLAALHDPSGVLSDPSTAAALVLLRAADLGRYGEISDELLAELGEEYPAAVSSLAERTGRPVIVGFLPAHAAEERLRDWEDAVRSRLQNQAGIAVLGPKSFSGDDFANPFDAETDALAHLPFRAEFQAAVALALADLVRASRRTPPKVIAVDGDETLWDGIAGEDGPEHVGLMGGRAQLARRLLQWRAAGALLVLVSNNDEATLRAVLDRPDSLLRAEHFSVISAGWTPKPLRLKAVAEELGLGLDTFMFLDDTPAEIARMRAALPEVLCVTCPPREGLPDFLTRLWPIAPRAATQEDAARADFYRQDKVREEARSRTTFADFLERLNLEMDFQLLCDDTMERSVQLARRTSQFNLRPQTVDEAELTRRQQDGEVWTVRARDRFGDYGQIAVLVIRPDGETLEVLGWMMSCRVLGRGAEERVLGWLADRAEALGCPTVRMIAERTPRNIPVRRLVAALSGGDPEAPGLEVLVPVGRLRDFRSWDATTDETVEATA
ncbi:HAD-IIIC family phosphatase [Streptomyces sp. NBC_00299]|uniref:HAD-IIIC family phosphatase n=1 Tax=Streptomyces sp. NBC_00299 TaxID=2975705 RepID=UPI002E294432|nr:HAD-IIIC family phosphatase [Streptomyces sp. NBC_00299]